MKKTVVYLAMIGFAAWPLAHITLVKTFDIDPWKLAGWGMYSTPPLHCSVRLFLLTPDEVGVYELNSLPTAHEAAVEKFLRRRRGLRRLAEPAGLARHLLAQYPAVDGVIIEVVQPRLDARSGYIEEKTTPYRYMRP